MDKGKYRLVVLGLSLAALTAGFVAGWSLRSPARRAPEDKPVRALPPATRASSPREQFIIFSAEKSLPLTTPDLLPARRFSSKSRSVNVEPLYPLLPCPSLNFLIPAAAPNASMISRTR